MLLLGFYLFTVYLQKHLKPASEKFQNYIIRVSPPSQEPANPRPWNLAVNRRNACICSWDSASIPPVTPALSCLSCPFSLRLSLGCLQAHCAALINTFTMCFDILKLHMSLLFTHVLNTHRACLTAALHRK